MQNASRGILPNDPDAKAFNGDVDVEGEKIHVKDGICHYDGETYLVSDDGGLIIDMNKEVMGRIENGKFIPRDDQYLQQLQAKGILG